MVSQTRGTTANGSTSDSTTWLATSVVSVFVPSAITIRAGIMVMNRRRNTETFHCMKPSTIICPAIVPTVDEDRPDASSAMPKA